MQPLSQPKDWLLGDVHVGGGHGQTEKGLVESHCRNSHLAHFHKIIVKELNWNGY